MKKAIFIDRDGTIIVEPPVTEQIDSLELLEFLPGAIGALSSMVGLGYELVLVSNQDGLGTESFPEETFWPAHNKMLKTLEGEGFRFDAQFIDRTRACENAPTRKPGTAMLTGYLDGSYDLAASYVIGDRDTDRRLAENLGAQFLRIDPGRAAESWKAAAETVRKSSRTVTISRKTSETDITLSLDIDGRGESVIDTGLKFFDHMLSQLPHHGGISLSIACKGDLEVDEHHTVEDVAIVLGQAIDRALGRKQGIERYGFTLPMDESRAIVLLDLGGRSEFSWDVTFTREYVGDVPTEMFRHFFGTLCSNMKCNLHIAAKGENNHHLIEGVFKAFARALRQAVRRDPFSYDLPSSKGIL